ncbi:hypothetical protein [Stieleria varia]|uniref:hypothetical protein n=1 Tax=Stieleria varia TaxID=2528005 RepID=UPI0011B5F83B|nr:hypothetical protein [Stieleria varia]
MKPNQLGRLPQNSRRSAIGAATAAVLRQTELSEDDATEESCGVWHFTSAFIGEIPSDQVE